MRFTSKVSSYKWYGPGTSGFPCTMHARIHRTPPPPWKNFLDPRLQWQGALAMSCELKEALFQYVRNFFSDTKQNRYNCHPLQCFSDFYTEIIHEFEECAPGLGVGGGERC